MSMAEIRRTRCVPAKRGMAVRIDGKLGVIVGSKGCYIMVRFMGDRHPVPCHPTWEVDYAPRIDVEGGKP